MPKHFRKGVKREHHFLKGLEKPLEEIASIPGVKKVIPGRIYFSLLKASPFTAGMQ